MTFVPVPCGRDNVVQFRIARFPAQIANSSFRRCNESWRVTRTAWFFDSLNFFPGYFFARLNHLSHGITITVAQVIEALLAGLKAEDVSLGKIDDVNVIPDASAIRSGIVGAEDFAFVFFAESDHENVRDEMCLDAMMLAKARGGETLEFQVEMACNGLFGSVGIAKYKNVSPFLLDQCDIAVFDELAFERERRRSNVILISFSEKM